jgi:hypothetical protein
LIHDLKHVFQLTHERRRAAVEFERLWGYKGVEDLLDTDYASSILSYDEEGLSDDSKQRRWDAEVGQGAKMVRGKTWRTKRVSTYLWIKSGADPGLQYFTLLKVLDHINRGLKARSSAVAVPDQAPGSEPTAGPSTAPDNSSGQPAQKKRKVSTKPRKIIRNTWYAAAEKQNGRGLKSKKSHPFVGMVRKSWLAANDPDSLLRLREDYTWWNEFENKVNDGDISDYDVEYLE